MDNKGACHVETKNNMYCRLSYRKCLQAVNKGQFSILFHDNSDSLRSAKDKKYKTYISMNEATRIMGISRTTRDCGIVGLMTG